MIPTGDDVLAALYQASPLGIALLAPDGRLRCANGRLQEILGRAEEELVARTCAELTHPGDVAAEIALFDEMMAGLRGDYQLNKRYLHKNGGVVWGQQTVSLRPGADGQPIIVCTVEDVTAARNTEEKQQNLMFALGERVKELTALHRTAQLLMKGRGSRPEQLRAVAALLPPAMQYPDITTGCVRFGDEVYATGGHTVTPWVLQAAFETADGRRGAIEVAYHDARPEEATGPFLAEEATLLQSLAEMVRAAIDRQGAEDALGETIARLDLAFIAAGMGIWEWDVERDQVRWSGHLSRMLGLDGESAGRFAANRDRVHPGDREGLFQRLHLAADGRDDLRDLTFRMRRTDDTWLHFDTRSLIVREPPARATRIVVVMLDVTARRGLEERLRQTP